jgi:streptogramin lyase
MFKSSWLCSVLLLMAGLMPGRKRRPQRRRPRWVRPCVEPLEDRCLLSTTINEFPLPSPSSAPDLMRADPNGDVWFTEAGIARGRFLGRITPTGQITELVLNSLSSDIVSFAFGNDGNIWVGGDTHIAEINPQGVLLHNYLIPSTLAYPYHALSIAFGPDGNIWYTEGYASGEVIGRLTPDGQDGQITEFPIPFQGDEITTGPDGNLWFDAEAHAIGRITPAGDVTIFNNPDNGQTAGAYRGLTSGPNGNLWMSQNVGNVIEEVNTAGQLVATFSEPNGPYLMTLGSDGNLWFTENGNNIGSITPQGIITEHPIPTLNSEGVGITKGHDGNIWFTEYAAGKIGEVVLNQPLVANAGGPYSIHEGDSLTLDASGSSDPDGDPLTYSWTINGHANAATGLSTTLSWPQLQALGVADEGTVTVQVTVTDGGGTASASTTLTVLDAPLSASAASLFAVPYEPLNQVLVATFTDPGSDGTTNDYSATVSWGDGDATTGVTITPNPTVTGQLDVYATKANPYTAVGTYTTQVTINDVGGSSASVTGTATVSAVAVVPDSCGDGQMLLVGGTAGDDTIVVGPGSQGAPVQATDLLVTRNGLSQEVLAPAGTSFSRVVVYAGPGNDDVTVAGSISLPAWLYGGDGNDRLKGGNGNNVLEGGDGDDLFVGGSGRDLLIGGTGADRMIGNGGDDILLGGTTAYDGNEATLCAIMAEWTSSHDFATRVANLTDQTSSAGFLSRLNGAYFLLDQGSGQTVFNDASSDRLTGSAGSDWFFAGTADKVTDLSASDLAFIFGL